MCCLFFDFIYARSVEIALDLTELQ